MRRSNTRFIGFILYLIFGLYFINYPFNFVKLPEFFSSINSWIIFIGGFLVLFGAINYLRLSRPNYY